MDGLFHHLYLGKHLLPEKVHANSEILLISGVKCQEDVSKAGNLSVTGLKSLPFARRGLEGYWNIYQNLPSPSLERRGLLPARRQAGLTRGSITYWKDWIPAFAGMTAF